MLAWSRLLAAAGLESTRRGSKMRFALIAIILSTVMGSAHAEEPSAQARGLAYAEGRCAECHAVERAARLSPNVEAPTFAEIANTPGISELALVSFFQTTHENMPDFIVPTAQQRDLIAYILSLKQ